jgi:hypothetical protein
MLASMFETHSPQNNQSGGAMHGIGKKAVQSSDSTRKLPFFAKTRNRFGKILFRAFRKVTHSVDPIAGHLINSPTINQLANTHTNTIPSLKVLAKGMSVC